MKAIKWTGPKTYISRGVIMPGDILTEEIVGPEVMQTWVNQGMAEWYVNPDVTIITGPEKTVRKKKR